MRTFISVVFALAIGALSIDIAAQSTAAPRESDPIRIGVLNPTTGGFAVFGSRVNTGIRLYFDAVGNTVGGRSIELVFADTGGDPQQALDAAGRLVETEQVDLLMGVVNSDVVLPIARFADERQIPLVITIGGARAATGEDRSPYVFRTALANGQDDAVLGWYVASELGHRRAASIAWDSLVGAERVAGFSAAFSAAGGDMVVSQAPPLETTNFGPAIAAVLAKGVDVAYAFLAGPSAVEFARQAREHGLTPDVQLAATDYFTSGVLDEMGANAEGLVQAGGYSPYLDNAENLTFLARFERTGGAEPGAYEAEGYLGAMVVAAAIEAVGGNLSDEAEVLDALAEVNLDGPGGPFRFDERGQAVRTVHITRVVQQSGTFVQSIVHSLPEVDQHWQPSN